MLTITPTSAQLSSTQLERTSTNQDKTNDWLSQLGRVHTPLGIHSKKEKIPSFKSHAFIRAAMKIQQMEKPKRTEFLERLAREQRHHESVIVLCRMLFESDPSKKPMRRPFIGAPLVLGQISTEKLGQEPIEIIDGVPFLVVRGYDLAGQPEAASNYLQYCLGQCRWSKFRYRLKMNNEYKEAYENLLGHPIFKDKLTQVDKDFLRAQID